MAIRKRALEGSAALTNLNVMFLADPGVGKTTAMATMMNLDRPGKFYFLDSDGLISETALKSLGIPVDRVDIFEVDTFEDARTIVMGARKALAENPESIAGFGVDTLSELSKQFTTNLAFDRYTRNARANRKDDQFEIDVKEHGKVVEQLRFLTRAMRDLPCHTVFTAHPKEDKEEDGTVYYRAGFGPKFAVDITKFCHAVVFMTTEVSSTGELIRVGYTDPYGKFRGKDNLNALPTKMLDPTFERIFKVVSGELSSEEVDADLAHRVAHNEPVAP